MPTKTDLLHKVERLRDTLIDTNTRDGVVQWMADASRLMLDLSREVEALRDDYENARELARPVCDALKVPTLHDAPAAIEALRADKDRIDWLTQHGATIYTRRGAAIYDLRGNMTIRSAIDDARKT